MPLPRTRDPIFIGLACSRETKVEFRRYYKAGNLEFDRAAWEILQQEDREFSRAVSAKDKNAFDVAGTTGTCDE